MTDLRKLLIECSVQEIRRLRMCAGYGMPSSGTAVDNAKEAK